MKRQTSSLKWAVAGSVMGLVACAGALYRTVKQHVEKKFEAHQTEVALQTLEGEGGLVLD